MEWREWFWCKRLQLNEKAFRFSRLAAVSQFTVCKCHKQNGSSEEEWRVIEIAHRVGTPAIPRVSAQCWSPVGASVEDRLIVSEQNADAFTNRWTEVITLPPWKLALVEIIQIYLTSLLTIFKVFVTVSEVSEQFM